MKADVMFGSQSVNNKSHWLKVSAAKLQECYSSNVKMQNVNQF